MVVPTARPPLTREAIVDAARQITIVGGMEGLNMRRVASSLGVTAPALYAHVRHKSDLLQAIAEGELERLVEHFEQVHETDPVERVRRYARIYVEQALEEPELYQVLFLTQPSLTLDQGDDLPIASKAFSLPATATIEAIESGAFKPADPLMASLTMWTAVHGAATVLLMGLELDDASTDELVTSVVETVIAGLSA